jgi:nucleoside-diphosphate-sugar epimerase
MKILVAGGAGFIGSHLCEELLRRGHWVTCIDNLSTGDMSNIGHLFGAKRFNFGNFGVTSGFEYAVDAVFHLASPAAPGDIRRLNVETLTANVEGTDYLMRFGTSKFMFLSSMKVLGDCPRVAPYIHGKRYGEHACERAGAKVARLGSVYGPRMRLDDSRAVPVFINKALRGETLSVWNGGAQLDSFCYVDDIVDGLIKFMDSSEHGIVEFGNPEPISIIDLARLIIDLTGSSSEIRTDENVLVVNECHKVPDISAARTKFEWEPKIDLKEGLMRTIEYVAEKNQKNNLHLSDQQLGSADHGIDISATE